MALTRRLPPVRHFLRARQKVNAFPSFHDLGIHQIQREILSTQEKGRFLLCSSFCLDHRQHSSSPYYPTLSTY
jgi:hypothetical protein